MTQAELLAEQLVDTRDWTLKLLADLSGDDWHFQPAAGLAHPLWLCGHLASAQDTLIHTRCLGGGVLDSTFKSHFPLGAAVKSWLWIIMQLGLMTRMVLLSGGPSKSVKRVVPSVVASAWPPLPLVSMLFEGITSSPLP